MLKAWIENNNIFLSEDETVAPSNAIEVPDGTQIADLKIENGQIVVKTQEEKEQEIILKVAKEKKNIVKEKIKEIENAILSKYPQSEITSWSFKVIEAQKILLGNIENFDLEVPIITNELKILLNREPTSQDYIDRAQTIMNNKERYSKISGIIAGVRSYFENITDEDLYNLDIESYFLNFENEFNL